MADEPRKEDDSKPVDLYAFAYVVAQRTFAACEQAEGFPPSGADWSVSLRTIARESADALTPTEVERFAAMGWTLASIEEACEELERLCGMARAEAAARITAEYKLKAQEEEGVRLAADRNRWRDSAEKYVKCVVLPMHDAPQTLCFNYALDTRLAAAMPDPAYALEDTFGRVRGAYREFLSRGKVL